MTVGGAIGEAIGVGGPGGMYNPQYERMFSLYGAPGAHQYSPSAYMQGSPMWGKDTWKSAYDAGYFKNPQGRTV